MRFDGGDKEDPFLTGIPSSLIEWVPVCPEFELGLGVPREAMRLEGKVAAPRLVTIRTRIDHTRAMERFARLRVSELAHEGGLDGYIFKRGSPSCGALRVPVYPGRAGRARSEVRPGVGLFAKAFMARFPRVPVEEEGRLAISALRRSFFERVFAHGRWRRLVAEGVTRERLLAFHAVHRSQFLARSPSHVAALERLLTGHGRARLASIAARYEEILAAALRLPATRRKRVGRAGRRALADRGA